MVVTLVVKWLFPRRRRPGYREFRNWVCEKYELLVESLSRMFWSNFYTDDVNCLGTLEDIRVWAKNLSWLVYLSGARIWQSTPWRSNARIFFLPVTRGAVVDLFNSNRSFRDLVKTKHVHCFPGGIFLFQILIAFDTHLLLPSDTCLYFLTGLLAQKVIKYSLDQSLCWGLKFLI